LDGVSKIWIVNSGHTVRVQTSYITTVALLNFLFLGSRRTDDPFELYQHIK